jgi:hypothetical protein
MMKYWPIVLLLIFAAACNGGTNILAPTPQPAPVLVASVTIVVSGIVTERTAIGSQPVAGAQVGLYAYNEGPLDPAGLIVSTQTGPDGRYSLQGTPQVSWVGASRSDYRPFEARLYLTDSRAYVFDIELLKLH